MSKQSQPALFILSTQLERAGAQRVAIMEARHFHQKGYQVTLGFLYDKQGLMASLQAEEPYKVINLNFKAVSKSKPAQTIHALRSLWQFLRFLHHERYQIVHTHSHYSNLLGLPLAWLARVPVRVATQHTDLSRFPRWFWRVNSLVINSPLACHMIAVSKHTQQFCVEMAGMKAEKVACIYNGVDVATYETMAVSESQKQALRASLNLSPAVQLLITVARLHPEKGHRYWITALQQIVSQHPDAQALFVGEGWLLETLQQQVIKANLQNHVHFLGSRGDVPQLLAIADLFVLPSESNEAMPLSVLEAMAAGLPVVVTDVGGAREMVTDGEMGYVVSPANSDVLVEKVSQLLADEELCQKMGAAAFEQVKTAFSWQETFADYEKVFGDCL